jgi:hypothetical protein
MNQALYAHMNNKRKMKKKSLSAAKKKKKHKGIKYRQGCGGKETLHTAGGNVN